MYEEPIEGRIDDKIAELIVLCQKILIIGKNTTVKIDGKEYYAMFSFKLTQ